MFMSVALPQPKGLDSVHTAFTVARSLLQARLEKSLARAHLRAIVRPCALAFEATTAAKPPNGHSLG